MSTNPQTSIYEIERGKPMPSRNHSALQARLSAIMIVNYDEQYNIYSEPDLELDGWKSVPDLTIYEKEPLFFEEDIIRLNKPPLCAIEILSAQQGMKGIIDKISIYFEKGVQSCWFVVPYLKQIIIYTSPKNHKTYSDGMTFKDEKLNISFSLKDLFRK